MNATKRFVLWAVGILCVLIAASLWYGKVRSPNSTAPTPTEEAQAPGAPTAQDRDAEPPRTTSGSSLSHLLARLEAAGLEGRREEGETLIEQILPFGHRSASHARDVLLTRQSLWTVEGIYGFLLTKLLQRIAEPTASEILFESYELLEALPDRDIAQFQTHSMRQIVPLIARFSTSQIQGRTLALMLSARKPGVRKSLLHLASLIGAGHPGLVDAVRTIMATDPDPDVRAAAVAALLKIGGPEDAPQVASILGSIVGSPSRQSGQEIHNMTVALVEWVGPEASIELMRESIRSATYSPNVTGPATALAQWYMNQPDPDLAPIVSLLSPDRSANEQMLAVAIINHWESDVRHAPALAPLVEELFLSPSSSMPVRVNALLTLINFQEGDSRFLRLYEGAIQEGGVLESESRSLLPYALIKHPYSDGIADRIAAELSTLDTRGRVSLINRMRLESLGSIAWENDPFRTILQDASASNSDPEARAAASAVIEANERSIRGE